MHFQGKRGGGPTHPVERVSWEDAVAFCRQLSARAEEQTARRRYGLPSEAEWEWACRGGAACPVPFHYGDSLSSLQANCDGNYPSGGAATRPSLRHATAVGLYAANLGLFDLHGNVWEWCQDWYGAESYAPGNSKDPQGPESGVACVLRGGSFSSSAGNCRAAYRNWGAPVTRISYIGCRVCFRLG